MAGNVRQGTGKFKFPNGDTYEGQWQDGVMHGNGRFTWAASGAEYDGEWVQGRRQGEGCMTYVGGARRQGAWAKDQIQMVTAADGKAPSDFHARRAAV